MKVSEIKFVSHDGDKSAHVTRVTGFGDPFYETTTYTRWSHNPEDYNVKPFGTFSEAVEHARSWTGRTHRALEHEHSLER